MKAKVLNVEKVQFKDGNYSFRVFALTEEGKVGNFFTSQETSVNDVFELSISVDNSCKFVVRKEKIDK